MSLRHLIVAALLGTTFPAYAATNSGNAETGRELVLRSCTTCHAATETATQSDAAPPLSFIARDNTQRPNWIRGWLMDPHPPMPGIMLSRQQINDIVAYLDVLAERESSAPPFPRKAIVDVKKGATFAQMVCAECHAVERGQVHSPNTKAPTFVSIAASSGMTATAIRVWLQTPHPTMPNLVLHDEEKDNVVAYILSLKSR